MVKDSVVKEPFLITLLGSAMVLADKEVSLCFSDISEHQKQTRVSSDDIVAQMSEEMKKKAAREL